MAAVVTTETGRKTARVSPLVAKRINQVKAAHEALDERRPPRSWNQEEDRDRIDKEVLFLIDRYESLAPHLSAPTLKAIRKMLRAHPFLRFRGQEYADAAPNYRLPTGRKFYWGGVRRLADGSVRAGGVGRKPQVLEEYERSPAGQKRLANGEPTFLPIE
jgi:hypothetical protein